MKEFIHSLTGTRTTVADDREAEYLAAGHKPVKSKGKQTGSKEPGETEKAARE